MRDPQKLASELEQLRELDPEELRERWETLFGTEPPAKLRTSLLIQRIAYRLQEKSLGGLKPATVWLLERIADDAAPRRQVSTTPIEMRLIIGGGFGGISGSAPRIDSAILKAVARARRWFDDLVSGRAASMLKIGQREGVDKRYISRMIRLAFLAPTIVESTAEGRQPPELTAQFLSTGRGDLPLSWQAQERLLGFADPA